MEYRFDFDDQLPDLPEAFDLDAVSQLFEQKLFGPSSPFGKSGTVRATRLQDTKYKPSTRCVTTYEMEIEKADGTVIQTIGVLEFTPEGVLPRIYQADPKLPWLSLATDWEGMYERFAALLSGNGDEKSELVEIEPVRYKPGLHCVFRYKVQTPEGLKVYYGKLFSDGSSELMNTITDLHQVSESNPDMPRIPKPVVHWPDMEMVLQPAVTNGVEFTKFAYDTKIEASVREGWMFKAGTTLGVFHQSTAPGEVRTIQDDLNDLNEYTVIMAKVKPKLAAQYEDAIQQIIAKVGNRKEPEPLAGHGAMRTDQFILQDDRLAIIDLDGYCWSNPARDLGNFLAYLCWKAIRQPEQGEFVERAGRAFLEGYLQVQENIDEYWMSIYQAASLLKIAGRRFRSLTFLEWPLIIHLIDAALATLKEDISNLEPGAVEDHRGTLVAHLSTSTNLTKFPATFIDKEFPALWAALNSEMMSDELEPILNSIACPDLTPTVRRAKLLAYKPGKRGVIRYDLDNRNCETYIPVFGKLYPEPMYCERAYRVMKYLAEEVFSKAPELGVPRPLGIVPQLSMLVFVPAEGQFLGEVISCTQLDSPQVMHTMELAGAWLAQLHTHQVPLEKQFRIENEIDNIQEWVELISKKYPQESRTAEHVGSYLIEKAVQLDFATNIPIHKDFHYEHILVNGGLKVFDFDEMRLGDPNFDLAHFCANFYLLAYRNHKHTSQFSSLQTLFFNAYASETGWQFNEKFLFFYIYSCLKIAKQLCKLRGPRPWPEGEEQRAQVWLMLEQCLTTVAYAKAVFNQEAAAVSMWDFSKIRRLGWQKANRISKSVTSSEAIPVSHRPLS